MSKKYLPAMIPTVGWELRISSRADPSKLVVHVVSKYFLPSGAIKQTTMLLRRSREERKDASRVSWNVRRLDRENFSNSPTRTRAVKVRVQGSFNSPAVRGVRPSFSYAPQAVLADVHVVS